MAVMLQRCKSENLLKRRAFIEATGTLSNIKNELIVLRNQVCSNSLAMNKQLVAVLEQAVQKWNAHSEESKRKAKTNLVLLKNRVGLLRLNHHGVYESTRRALDDVCSKNVEDCQSIVSAVIMASNLHKELEKRASTCNQELERSQLMCQQYKELFEQEQNKVFELLAEKEASLMCVHSSVKYPR